MNNDRHSRWDDVADLVEIYLTRQSDGSPISIAELCGHVPELTESVAHQIHALEKVDAILESSDEDLFDSSNGARDSSNSIGQQSDGQYSLGQRKGIAESASSYQIQRFHAHGGCSEVYVAEDTQLGRTVAIKFLRPDVENVRSFQARLQREAEITSRLDHPGIVSIHGQGTDESGLPFYTMRFIEGDSLSQKIQQLHPDEIPISAISLRKILKHFVDVCQIIGYAHSRGVIHRDVKPANIITGNFGESYVVDWGLAKEIGVGDPKLHEFELDGSNIAQKTKTSTIENAESACTADSKSANASAYQTRLGNSIGTPAFMSPEQAVGTNIGCASDIFNLGATLYSILTGSAPYTDPSLIQVMENAKQANFVPVEKRVSKIPMQLAAICQRAMAQSQSQRYASAIDLANDIENYLAGEPVSAYPEGPIDRTMRWVRRHRTLVTTVITTCFAGMVISLIANQLLLDSNRSLTQRESEAKFHKNEAQKSLIEANENLYAQQIALAYSELNKNNVERAEAILDACPAKFRSWEWNLLKFTIRKHKPFATILKNGEIVVDLEFAPDGSLLAAGYPGGLIRLFDVNEFQHTQTVTETEATEINVGMRSYRFAFSPDGSQLAVVGNERRSKGAIQLWDVASRTLLGKRRGDRNDFNCVTWSDDGTRIASGGASGDVKIRNVNDLKPVQRITGAHEGIVQSIVFKDGSNDQFVSAGIDGKIRHWNELGNQTASISTHQKGVQKISIVDGILYSAGKDPLIHAHDLDQQDQSTSMNLTAASSFIGMDDSVESFDISPDGHLIVAGGLDRQIRVWDTSSMAQVATIRNHTSHIRHVTFCIQGFFATAGDDGGVKIWRTNELTENLPKGSAVHFSNLSNQLIANSLDQLSVWNSATSKPIIRHSDMESPLLGIIYANQSDSFVTLHRNGTVQFFEDTMGLKPRHFKDNSTHENSSIAYCAVFNADDSLLFVGHGDGTIDCWNTQTGKLVQSAEAKQRVTSIEMTANQKTIVTSSWENGEVKTWDTATLSLQRTIPAHSQQTLDIAMHPFESAVASTGKDGSVRIWNVDTGRLIDEFHFGASWLNCLAFTPDGTRLVTGSEHTLMFWDTQRKQEVLSISMNRCVHSISFSHDGNLMAVAGEDPEIRIWQVGELSETVEQ